MKKLNEPVEKHRAAHGPTRPAIIATDARRWNRKQDLPGVDQLRDQFLGRENQAYRGAAEGADDSSAEELVMVQAKGGGPKRAVLRRQGKIVSVQG